MEHVKYVHGHEVVSREQLEDMRAIERGWQEILAGEREWNPDWEAIEDSWWEQEHS